MHSISHSHLMTNEFLVFLVQVRLAAALASASQCNQGFVVTVYAKVHYFNYYEYFQVLKSQ